MAIIRHGTEADLDAIDAMGAKFLAYTAYGAIIRPEQGEVKAALRHVLENGTIFVADKGGTPVGFLAALICPAWFSPSTKTAIEMAWWMEEEHRVGTAAIRLLFAYEQWAQEQGARFIVMSDLVINGQTPLGSMLQRLNYTMTERAFMKEISQ
jgi:hypothetical protein